MDKDSIVPLNLMCGFQVRSSQADKKAGKNVIEETEVMSRINTRGCIVTIEVSFLLLLLLLLCL